MTISRALFARLHKAIDDNRQSDAVMLLTQMIDSQHKSMYDRDRDYLERLTELGDTQWNFGDVAAAEDHYALALRLYEHFFDQHDSIAIGIARRLCEVLELQGRTEELDETLNRAYRVVEKLQAAQYEMQLSAVRNVSAQARSSRVVGSAFVQPHRALKVLVVEDNPDDAQLLHEFTIAQELPLVLEVADRLGLALERVQTGGHDVILLDLSLPDSAPENTLSTLKKAAPRIPIIVLTGMDDTELAIQALRSGARDYLVKGQLDGTVLANSIARTLERRRHEGDADLEKEVRDKVARQFIEHSSVASMMMTVDFTITAVNQAIYSAMGWNCGELRGRNLAEILTAVPIDNLNELWSNNDPYRLIEIEFCRSKKRGPIRRLAKVWTLKDLEGAAHSFVLTLQ